MFCSNNTYQFLSEQLLRNVCKNKYLKKICGKFLRNNQEVVRL